MTAKTCQRCGRSFERRRKEAFRQFERRRYCSRPCANSGRAADQRVADSEFRSRYRQVTTPDGRHLLEHRWVMEQVLGRRLRRDEHVHHINHNRLDNRPENLELVTSAEHGQRHTWRPTVKSCVVCSTEFVPHKTKRARQQTCSVECRNALMSRLNNERVGGPYFLTCERCGSQKRIPRCRFGVARFCSTACANQRASSASAAA